MSEADFKLSKKVQAIARNLEHALKDAAGAPVNFSLFMWTDGRAQYVANSDRADVIRALEEMIAKWKAGMPDIPAHEVRG